MLKKKVLVFTGNRAEYGLQYPIIKITISKLEKYCSYSEKCKSDIIKKLH